MRHVGQDDIDHAMTGIVGSRWGGDVLEDRIIVQNPAVKLGRYFQEARVVHAEIEPLTESEVPIFLAKARERDAKKWKGNPEYCPLFLCAIHTGMRMGEILGLTWAGVDLFRRTVMVFKSKNGERRTIPLNQTALELLKHKYGSRSVETELVFPSEALTRLNASNISRSLHLALKKAKMTDFHFHDLRHTCATRMVQAGVDLYKVQRLLGHKSPIMTQRYAHHYPESLRDGIEVLDVGRGVSTNLAQLRVVTQADSASC